MAGKGIEHLTIRAVAAEAGCTTGLVMHRFPGRKALLAHARDLLHARTRVRVERLEAEAGTPRAALRAILAQGMALNEDSAQEALVWMGFLAASVGDEELIALHRKNNRAWRARVAALVTASAPDWAPERVDTAVFALVGATEGAAQLACFDPETYSAPVQEAMLDSILDAYGLA
ncbi:TetR/AcrR family transcriptional regulator [Glycomyces tritici]|uniref:TetR/AcrR family transcriptional regulator n=1 Tax=Glycomyces tritici TaxID=2665176 RepID=A0ABT7YM76_9ACTN|nr:TetR/AcrR family transcriptional regulator [Glycomyces tritici]MDN3239735.1 TetR/AcrR family transcriptional regulator [Glycomyces tritici]